MKENKNLLRTLLIFSIAAVMSISIFSLTVNAAIGDDCSDPIIVNIPADLNYYDDWQTTCGRVDNYESTCLGIYDKGEDIIYELIVSSNSWVDITLDPIGCPDTGILIDNECPDDDGSCIAYSICTSPPSPHGFTNLFLAPGTYYVMIDNYVLEHPDPCIEAFHFSIEQSGEEREFGDAPEDALAYPSTGAPGWFPTCKTCGTDGWIQHDNYGAWFGPSWEFEIDGNAGLCPGGFPPYDVDEGFQDGDAGLLIPEPFTIDPTPAVVPFAGYTGTSLGVINQVAIWGTDIDIYVHNTMPSATTGYVNVLIDWNQDGDWKDNGEHVLIDQPIPNPYDGPLSAFTEGLPLFIGPYPGYVWSRFTISESPVGPGWYGEGDFEDGETEDYLLLIDNDCEPSIDIEKYVWDPSESAWVDADTTNDAIDFTIGSIAEFKITIHNDGECCDLTEIWVDDIAERMEVTDYSIWPDYYTYTPSSGTNLGWWSFTDYEPLSPCNWINMTIEVEIEGDHCNIYNNSVWIEAYCEDQDVYVYDEDNCYVHAVQLDEYEYGDAPEGSIAYPSTMTMGSFPTCTSCGPSGFIRHHMLWNGLFFFGNMKDNELDGNAGVCPSFPPYDQDEGFYPGPDGGLMAPDIYTIDGTLTVVPLTGGGVPYLGYVNTIATWGIETDMWVQNLAPIDVFVNVLADWNQNGQWGEPGEHILINHIVPAGFIGPLSVLGPPPIFIGPNDGYIWFRHSITAMPCPMDWNGEGEFEDGETEDYLLLIVDDDPPTAHYTWSDADGSGTGTIIDFDASTSTDDNGITTYEWDWTNDGSYDYTGGPTASHDYGDTNSYVCKLRVTDTIGQTDTYIDTIQAIVKILDLNQSIFDRGFRMMPGWDAAQEFIPTLSTLSSVDLYMSMFGAPTGNVTFQICAGSASGTVLYECEISPSDVPSYPTYLWVAVDIPDITVTIGDTYYIVLKDATGADSHNCMQWGWCDSYPSGSGGPYDGGWFWFRKLFNPTWSPIRDWDYTVRTYGY